MTKLNQRSKPCETCPYLRSTPLGIWDKSEYLRLLQFDEPTYKQSSSTFRCHNDSNCLCQGWLDCHDATQLLSIRIASIQQRLAPDFNFERSGADVYSSAKELVYANMRACGDPGDRAKRCIKKLTRSKSRKSRHTPINQRNSSRQQ